MKRLLKVLGIGLLLGIALVGCVVGYFAAKWPPTYEDVPEPAITASTDPQVVARGDYLFHAVAHCGTCHAPRADVYGLQPGAKIVPRGGGEWNMGPLGTLRSPNLTSHATGMAGLSDGQIARAIRHNVRADHTPATMMISVGGMSDEDLTAIVSYMRTIPPVDHEVAPSELGVLGKMLFQGPMGFFGSPKDYPIPPFVKEGGGVSVERGRYLFEGPAFCAGCHSDIAWDGEALSFVGQIGSGRVDPSFVDEEDPRFVFVAPNLTPDPHTGAMWGWSEAQFVERMRAGRVFEATPMPWESYRLMTDDDLKSLFAYLQQLPPTEKFIGPSRVEKGDVPQ